MKEGELFFLSHPENETLVDGFGLSLAEPFHMVGVLVIQNQGFLDELAGVFGEYVLVYLDKLHGVLTARKGITAILCRMNIERESASYLKIFDEPTIPPAIPLLRNLLLPFLEKPTIVKVSLSLKWDSERKCWNHTIAK